MKHVITVLLLLASLVVLGMAPLNYEIQNIVIMGSPDTTNFPQVTIDFRAIRGNGLAIETVTKEQLSIVENNYAARVTNLRQNPNGTGLNLYFVIDQYNRTDSDLVTVFLDRFANEFMVDGLDQVTVLSNQEQPDNEGNPYLALKTSSTAALSAFAKEFENQRSFKYINDVLMETYSLAAAETNTRTQPTYIIVLSGPDTMHMVANLLENVNQQYATYRIPLHVIQVEHRTLSFRSINDLKELANSGRGNYYRIRQNDAKTQVFAALDEPFFARIVKERVTYTVEYRSISGDTGIRNVTINVNEANTNSLNQNAFTYSVLLANPQVSFSQPTNGVQIVRNALQNMGNNLAYDLDSTMIEFDIAWSDGYPRSIVAVDLKIISPIGVETVSMPVGASGTTYQHRWDLRQFVQEGENPITLEVVVTDELGLIGTSDPVALSILNAVPEEIIVAPIVQEMAREMEEKLTRTNYLAYGLAGVALLLVVALFIMRNKIRQIDIKGVGSAFVAQVRKTLIPVRSNQKPIASLEVISGPQNMIGERLPFATEDVKLGRDPNIVDFAFFSDSNSSVSGMHAVLRRQNGVWLIENHSSSGETVLNGSRIPDDRPSRINHGDRVRLGYLAQQCVEFIFHVGDIQGASQEAVTPRSTEVTSSARSYYEDVREVNTPRTTDIPLPNSTVSEEPTLINVAQFDEPTRKMEATEHDADDIFGLYDD